MEMDENRENSGTLLTTFQKRKTIYRNLLNRTEVIDESKSANLQTATEIGEILRNANELNDEINIENRVGNADETLLDGMVLSTASEVLKRCVSSLDVFTSSYDPAEFAEKIISYNTREDDDDSNTSPDFTLLLKCTRKIIPQLPHYKFIFGSYDLNNLPEPKPKKERQKYVRQEKATKKEPEKVVNTDKEDEGIEKIIKLLNQVLLDAYKKNGEKPINYWDFVIDTSSYSTTVENIFYFSFLVRDGKAQFGINKNTEPVIKPMHKNDLKEYRDEGGKNQQIVLNISMDEWMNHKHPGLLQKRRSVNT